LLIAGTGNGEERLRKAASDSSNIWFLGYVPEPELQTLYREATAVIARHLCATKSFLVVIEAWRQKNPPSRETEEACRS
jgi:hypothetical protein